MVMRVGHGVEEAFVKFDLLNTIMKLYTKTVIESHWDILLGICPYVDTEGHRNNMMKINALQLTFPL